MSGACGQKEKQEQQQDWLGKKAHDFPDHEAHRLILRGMVAHSGRALA
jgi:hypothetical protein